MLLLPGTQNEVFFNKLSGSLSFPETKLACAQEKRVGRVNGLNK